MIHKTVLLQETINGLDLQPNDVVIDGTLGNGGHSEEMLKRMGDKIDLIVLDLDEEAIDRSKMRLKQYQDRGARIHYFQKSFKDFDQALEELSFDHVDKFILDLGLSSNQLQESGRGFTFQQDEPLKMTFSRTTGENELTAYDVVNSFEEENLADIIYGFGEEGFSRRIAKAIVEQRTIKPIQSSGELASIIRSSVPFWYRNGRIHPATKTFQAIRITVNDELGALKATLSKGFEHLMPTGRIAVISFHSLEDRIVKNFFKDREKEGRATLLNKKPIIPSEEEIRLNPRARSSKLRTIIKI